VKAALALVFGCATGARLAKKRAVAQSTCGGRPGAPDPMTDDAGIQIVNGREAPVGAWPWQIHLGGCGASILSPEWLMSAAHCGNPSTAYAGLHNRSRTSDGQSRSIVQNIKHPSYGSPSSISNDFMLLRVSPAFNFGEGVGAVCLPAQDPPVGGVAWITGWGTLSSGGSRPALLQEAAVDIKSNQECKNAYGSSSISDDMICANGNNNGGTTDACQGDSGGPMVYEDGGRWFLIGATSWGRGCANPSYPGVWARVPFVNEWVTQNTGIAASLPGPTPAPVPTPEPPTPAPGTWELSGSGCTMSGSCVSSSNHPGNYGNNEQCSITLFGDIPLSVEAFNTEARYDFLTMGGTQYSGSSGPSSGTYSGVINWNSDFSIVTSGWRLCRTDQAAEVSPQNTIDLNVAQCANSNTIATLSGYSPSSVRQGQENFINAWGTISEDVTGGNLDVSVRLTGFPWTNLGSISNHNICTPFSLELRALGIWGGTIDFEGLACPVLMSQGEINLPIKLTLAEPSAIPSGARAEFRATAGNGAALLCADVTTR